MYAQGRGGVTQNDTAAVRWYTKAAEQEFPPAENALGYMYDTGRGGLAHDEDEAVRLYRKSALQGFDEAQDNLKSKGLSWQPSARLGVDVQNLTRDMAESASLPLPDSAWIGHAAPGSAAQRVGLKPGDVILKVNGESITHYDDFLVTVGCMNPGDRVTLEILRNQTSRIGVTLNPAGRN